MKVLRGEKQQEYILEFSSEEEFENFLQQTDQEGEFLIPESRIPKDAVFRATATGSLRSRRIKPLKIVNEGDESRAIIMEKTEKAEAPPPSQEPAESSEEKRELAKTVAEQIRAMTVTEKSMLAMRANLAERRVLMQDTNPKIQEFLLRNPRLTEPELAFLAKNPMSAIPTILTIIQHKEWMGTDAIRQGILTNPKTPPQYIMDKIPTLSAGDLIKMHHAKNLREDIRDAVDRQMKKRGIRVRKIDF
ncbi:hypothetical protein L0222_04250 [bacterium]|nr:hypothetical protein [bacterium]MCI0602479.1 hypothetical protein [bacterium]